MPALPVVPKVIRYDFFQTLGANTRIRDHLFFSYSGTLSNADLITLLTTAGTSWGTNISGLLENTHNLTMIQGTDLSSAASAQNQVSMSHPGTGAGAALANSLAGVIRFKIARRYRGGHPRFYLAGLASSVLVNGEQVNSASIAAIVNGFAAFVAGCMSTPPAAVGTMKHENVSYFQGFTNKTFPSGRVHAVPTPRVTPLIDDVQGYSLNPIFGTQRRRLQQSI